MARSTNSEVLTGKSVVQSCRCVRDECIYEQCRATEKMCCGCFVQVEERVRPKSVTMYRTLLGVVRGRLLLALLPDFTRHFIHSGITEHHEKLKDGEASASISVSISISLPKRESGKSENHSQPSVLVLELFWGQRRVHMSASVVQTLKQALRAKPPSVQRLAPVTALGEDSALYGLEEFSAKDAGAPQMQITAGASYQPLLRLYSPFRGLVVDDFNSLSPDTLLKNVITGRYSTHLESVDKYYLNFDNIENAKRFCADASGDKLLNGRHVSPNWMTRASLMSELRYIVPPVLPDLEDVATLINNFKQNETEIKVKDFMKSLASVFKITGAIAESDKYEGDSSYFRNIAEQILQNSHNKDFQYPTVNRENCVIFRNIPPNIHKRKISSFFWDLEWMQGRGDNIRFFYQDKQSQLKDYILIFKDRDSALQCILRANNRPFLYDPVMPHVNAELL